MYFIISDKGTKELQKKRALHVTIEPLDLVLKNEIITASQHKIGMRFRWLYTLKFGLPTLQSKAFYELEGGLIKKSHDDEWLYDKEKEYISIVNFLKTMRLENLIAGICIHHVAPIFLTRAKCDAYAEETLGRFQFGMRELEIFSKSYVKKNY